MNFTYYFRWSLSALLFLPGLAWGQYHREVPTTDGHPRQWQVDVEHYEFSLQLDGQTDSIFVSEAILLRHSGAESVVLDLKLYDGKAGMHLMAVSFGELEATWKPVPRGLEVSLEGLPADSTLRLGLAYGGRPADGLIVQPNKYGALTYFSDNWPNRASHYLAVVDHNYDKARVTWNITCPADLQVVASGKLVREEVTDGIRTATFRTALPIPPKITALAASPFATDTLMAEPLPMRALVWPENAEKGFYDYAMAVEAVEFFTDMWGPMPWQKLDHVQSNSRFGGMENVGNIFYHPDLITGNRDERLEEVIAHEVVHQWFGNSVTEADWHHLWLSEGFATYFENYYMCQKYGEQNCASRWQREKSGIFSYYSRRPAAVVDVAVGTNYMGLLNANSYNRGAFFLHMLSKLMGEEVFLDGIKQFYDQHRLGHVLTPDLRQVMEEVSGLELEGFFEQWLYRPVLPELSYSYDKASGDLLVTQHQDGEPFAMMLPFLLDTGKTINIWVDEAQTRARLPKGTRKAVLRHADLLVIVRD